MTFAIPASLVLAVVRALGLVALLPFGASLSGLGGRLAVAVGLGALSLGNGGEVGPVSVLGVLVEFVIGLALALPAVLVLEMSAFVAEVVEAGRGQTIARFYSPFIFDFETSLSALARALVWAYLSMSGILCHLVVVYMRSFTSIPYSVTTNPARWSVSVVSPWSMGALSQMAQMLRGALGVAIPFSILFFLVEVCCGFIAKVIPQANLLGESFLFKSVGCAALLMSAGTWGYGESLLLLATSTILNT